HATTTHTNGTRRIASTSTALRPMAKAGLTLANSHTRRSRCRRLMPSVQPLRLSGRVGGNGCRLVANDTQGEGSTMNTALYADNDLQQEIIDGIMQVGTMTDGEIEMYLRDMSQASDLYNFFGFMVTNDHILRTYNIFKDAIREELSGLQEGGLNLRESLRPSFEKHPGYWDCPSHIDFAALALQHAIWNASHTLLSRITDNA